MDDRLTLRSLSDTQSAYAAVMLYSSFFEQFTAPSEVGSVNEMNGDPGATSAPPTIHEMQKTKFVSRVLAWACKPARNIVRLHAYFASQGTNNLFVLRAELLNGLVRTHSLHYEDARILQPEFDMAQPFQLCARPLILHNVLDRMHGTEEMSILVSPTVVQFQSYHDPGDAASVRGPLHTALAYDLAEFDAVHLDHASAGEGIVRPALCPSTGMPQALPLAAVTFGTKELKAALAFCQGGSVQSEEVSLLFSTPGNPLLFTTQGIKSQSFTVELILATVEGPHVQPAPSSALALLLQECLEKEKEEAAEKENGGGFQSATPLALEGGVA